MKFAIWNYDNLSITGSFDSYEQAEEWAQSPLGCAQYCSYRICEIDAPDWPADSPQAGEAKLAEVATTEASAPEIELCAPTLPQPNPFGCALCECDCGPDHAAHHGHDFLYKRLHPELARSAQTPVTHQQGDAR